MCVPSAIILAAFAADKSDQRAASTDAEHPAEHPKASYSVSRPCGVIPRDIFRFPFRHRSSSIIAFSAPLAQAELVGQLEEAAHVGSRHLGQLRLEA